MQKTHYKKELTINGILKNGESGNEVKKVQEWLNLWRYIKPEWLSIISIDGDYGAQTKSAVMEFQQIHGLETDGIAGPVTFGMLSSPLRNAFESIAGSSDLRALIVSYAKQHLRNIPRELNSRNEGPWVRAYMDGNEGAPWAWCMGFVQTILDQACNSVNQNFTAIMPHSYSCDVVGSHGLSRNSLLRNEKIRNNPSQVQPGDIFLNVRTPHDWVHTGIITGIQGDWFHTIEGNTNDEGSREGFEVCKRMRNFMNHNMDVFKVN
ncbi:MAG: peptidoglycan-binding domain-containing protein [Bacteroidia bacterium]